MRRIQQTFDYAPEKLTEEPVPDYSAFWYGDISPEIDVEGIPDEYEMFNDIGLQRTMDEVGISADEFDEIVEKQFLDELDDRTVELDNTKSALSSRMQQQFEVAKKEKKTESDIVNNLLRSKKKLTPKEKKALAEKRAERKKNSDDLFCWKCTAQNLEHCNKSGTAQKCPHDQRICGIELRKRDGRIVGVQMGCQSSSSCEANKKQNFIHPYKRLTQCRPEWFMPYSVCRQCCSSN
ncbi:unnamed protein product [Oikopleura dioica]|uniref:Uncharacterized protein n=1 Tax=Oikopleura dioica TaxID=34765 RepID=E4Z1Z0_OIKDI|nr:unnamed protein product [Oikopleura dioica]